MCARFRLLIKKGANNSVLIFCSLFSQLRLARQLVFTGDAVAVVVVDAVEVAKIRDWVA